MPPGQGGDQVADTVGVETAGEEHAGETLPDGAAQEGLLLVVDLEMGADGPVETLLREEGLAFGGCQGLGGGIATNLEGGWEDGLDGGGILGEEDGWLRN